MKLAQAVSCLAARPLRAGRYQVSDRSPRLLLVGANGIGHQTWSRPVTVTVTAHHITRITLASIVP